MNEKIMKQEANYDWLKDEVHCLYEEKKELQARIDKAIEHLEIFIGDPQLNKYDTLKILMYTRDILKGSDKNVD